MHRGCDAEGGGGGRYTGNTVHKDVEGEEVKVELGHQDKSALENGGQKAEWEVRGGSE